jgi:hypothetical protein
MGKINLGNFGLSSTAPAPLPNIEPEYQAAQRLGESLVSTGYQAGQMRQQAAAATASNNLLDHQLAIEQQVETVRDGLATGTIKPEDARAQFDKGVATLQPPLVDHLTPEASAAYSRGAQRVVGEAGFKIDGLIDVAHRQNFKDQFTSGLDKLGKLANLPGANVDAIIAQGQTFAPVGRAAGVSPTEVDTAIQNWTDQTRYNQAVNAAINVTDSMKGLKALQRELSAKDGYYTDKLDGTKRNAVLAQVTNRIDVLQNRLDHLADRREADAQRAMYEIDRQISTGVPAPPEQMANWAARVSGTSFAADFGDVLKDQNEIQDVLRLPPAQQISFVQDKAAKIDQSGGTVREQANLARLTQAVTKNVNTMQQAPLLFNAQRTGQDVEALDWSQMLVPGSNDVFAKQLSARETTIATMQKQYGPTVLNRPLLPQEAASLAGALTNATADQSVSMFGALRNAAGDDSTYNAIMAQIAPDSPVKASAGLIASRQRDVTLKRNWIASDVLATSPDVARTMLRGEAIINPTKSDKAQDGHPKLGLYLPDQAPLQAAFADAVGDAFAGRSGAAEIAFQNVKAYYVGKADAAGRLAANAQDVDSKILQEAITATLGQVVDYNGNGRVVAPWGMDKSTFENSVQRAWQAQVGTREVKGSSVEGLGGDQLARLGLENYGSGTYKVKVGRSYLTIGGKPVVLNVDPRLPAPPQ